MKKFKTFLLLSFCFTIGFNSDVLASSGPSENDGTTIRTYDAFEVFVQSLFGSPLVDGSYNDAFQFSNLDNFALPEELNVADDGVDGFLMAIIDAREATEPDIDPTKASLSNLLTWFRNSPNYEVRVDTNPDGGFKNEFEILYTGNRGSLPGVPIDGGLSFLAVGGILFGIRKFRKNS